MTVPSEDEAQLARAATQVLNRHMAEIEALRLRVILDGRDVTTVELPLAAARPLLAILEAIAVGRPIDVKTMAIDVTAQQAADILNVSAHTLDRLMVEGTLPTTMAGDQRRLPLRSVLAYKHDRQANRRNALDALAASDQRVGLR